MSREQILFTVAATDVAAAVLAMGHKPPWLAEGFGLGASLGGWSVEIYQPNRQDGDGKIRFTLTPPEDESSG